MLCGCGQGEMRVARTGWVCLLTRCKLLIEFVEENWVAVGYSAYFLAGATATGKSAVAQVLAERLGMAILSADSMMVYRGMDVGTAKPLPEERGGVLYYGIDLVGPAEKFSVWDYRQHALAVFEENAVAGRDVIVVGGTGLYIKSLTHGLRNNSGEDAALRSEWESRVEAEGIEVLQRYLAETMPLEYGGLDDKANLRRLLRLLETGGGENSWDGVAGEKVIVGLSMDNARLHGRIAERVEQMYAAGLVDEVQALLDSGRELSATALQAIGYAEAVDFLGGRVTLADAKERTIVRTRRLAKRQRTWFRHQADVVWVEVGESMDVDAVADRVEELWREYGATEIEE